MAIIYFMRHSEPLKPTNIYNSDYLQLQNEKWRVNKRGNNKSRKSTCKNIKKS